jgi:hypothetical protein
MSESDGTAISIAIFTAIFSGAISLLSLYFTNKHNQNLADSDKRHKDELNKANQQHEKDLARLENHLNKELEEVKQKHNEELAKLNSRLEIQKDERAAIRNYEYEARQRLYQVFEPLLFLLVEHSESAYSRICGLARAAKDGHLQPNGGWLSSYGKGYFIISTIYRLLLPLAVFRLMQRRLTIFDLDLVPSYKAQYSLSKALYFTFSDHVDLAQCPPEVEGYDPEKGSQQDRDMHPEKYRLQGIYLGLIDNLAEALIVYDPKGDPRLRSYGEFKREYFDPSVHDIFKKNIANLFYNFHPKTMPVLWRILLAQAHIYQAIVNTREMKDSKSSTVFTTLKMMSDKERQSFDWRHTKEEAKDEEVFVQPFSAVESYLQDKLGRFMETKGS